MGSCPDTDIEPIFALLFCSFPNCLGARKGWKLQLQLKLFIIIRDIMLDTIRFLT